MSPVKSQYSEREAAEKLGISVNDLRGLVRTCMARKKTAPPLDLFRRADLVLLQVLAANPKILGDATVRRWNE